MDRGTTLTVEPCPCGQKGCHSANIAPLTYGQGVMNREHAEFLVKAVNERDELLTALRATREALEVFSKLGVPSKPQGNAGIYSIFHKHILAAAATLARHSHLVEG